MSNLYSNPKMFVDKKLQFSPEVIIRKFDELLLLQNGKKLTLEQITKFIEDNFESEGCEITDWGPEDWNEEPEFIAQLKDSRLRGLARSINHRWKALSRKLKEDVRVNPDLYSFQPVPNGFIVPGENYKEFYYWDTYWTVKGLLHCDMLSTVRGIIENLEALVTPEGYIPSGPRLYHRAIPTPPFLCLIMKEYLNKTPDIHFLRKHLKTLESEIEYWRSRRSAVVEKDGRFHLLFDYGKSSSSLSSSSSSSLNEDEAEDDEDDDPIKAECFKEDYEFDIEGGIMKYGAESVLRGKKHYPKQRQNLSSAIPVDLNCLMYANYVCMSEFHSLLGDSDKADTNAEKGKILKDAINSVLWDESERMWFDFDCQTNTRQTSSFYASNLFPLWAECYDDPEYVSECTIDYLTRNGISLRMPIVDDDLDSDFQWDFPHSWPPVQHIVVFGLWKTNSQKGKNLSLNIARSYVKSFIHTYALQKSGNNRIKNLVENEKNSGLAWINGVLIDFIVTFGDSLMEIAEEEFGGARPKSSSSFSSFPLVKRTPTPEKHELEISEKNAIFERSNVHPALDIEEDCLIDVVSQRIREETEKEGLSSLSQSSTRVSSVDRIRPRRVPDVSITQPENLVLSGGSYKVNEMDLKLKMPKSASPSDLPKEAEFRNLVRQHSFNKSRTNFGTSFVQTEISSRVYLVKDTLTVQGPRGKTLDVRLELEVEVENDKNLVEEEEDESTAQSGLYSKLCSFFCWPFNNDKSKKKEGHTSGFSPALDIEALKISFPEHERKNASMNNMDLLALDYIEASKTSVVTKDLVQSKHVKVTAV